MKKWLKSVVLVLVVAAMLVSLFGCGAKSAGSDEGSKTAATSTAPTDPNKMPFDMTAFDKFKGQKISVWQWWDQSDDAKKMDQEFMNKTGITLEFTNIPWDQFLAKTVAAVASGAGPDVIYHDRGMPTWVVKKILLPVSDYIDLTKEPLATVLSQPHTKYYTWAGDGKVYGISNPVFGYKMYYNKEKLEAAGVEDPWELWKSGQWNWQKFFEIGQALTLDTNGDGKIEQYGYDAWDDDAWFLANGVNYIKYDSTGKPLFNLDDPAAIAALQAKADTSSKYKFRAPYNPDVDPQKKFLDGTTAMDYWGDWDLQNMTDKLGDKLGYVPFPIGPDYPDKNVKAADITQSTGLGIASSTKNAELAAAYIKYVVWPMEAKNPEQAKKDNEALLKRYKNDQALLDAWKEIANMGVINNVQGFGTEVHDLIYPKIIWSGDSTPAQRVATNKAAIQAAIDNVMK